MIHLSPCDQQQEAHSRMNAYPIQRLLTNSDALLSCGSRDTPLHASSRELNSIRHHYWIHLIGESDRRRDIHSLFAINPTQHDRERSTSKAV